jgi:hypothetical protein
MPIDEARKILKRKVMSAFHGLIKLDPEDLVHGPGDIYKKKTFYCLSQYSVCIGDMKSEYSLDFNVP